MKCRDCDCVQAGVEGGCDKSIGNLLYTVSISNTQSSFYSSFHIVLVLQKFVRLIWWLWLWRSWNHWIFQRPFTDYMRSGFTFYYVETHWEGTFGNRVQVATKFPANALQHRAVLCRYILHSQVRIAADVRPYLRNVFLRVCRCGLLCYHRFVRPSILLSVWWVLFWLIIVLDGCCEDQDHTAGWGCTRVLRPCGARFIWCCRIWDEVRCWYGNFLEHMCQSYVVEWKRIRHW